MRPGGETKLSFRDFSVNSLMLLAKDGIVPSRPEGGLPWPLRALVWGESGLSISGVTVVISATQGAWGAGVK